MKNGFVGPIVKNSHSEQQKKKQREMESKTWRLFKILAFLTYHTVFKQDFGYKKIGYPLPLSHVLTLVQHVFS